MGQDISTLSMPLTKVFRGAECTTDGAIVQLVPTITEPTGDGIVDLRAPYAFNYLRMCVYGTNTATQTFLARITGWHYLGNLWVPMPLITMTGALGAAPGIALTNVGATQLFAKTLAIGTAWSSKYTLISATNIATLTAWALVDMLGASKAQIQLSINGSSVTLNALAQGF